MNPLELPTEQAPEGGHVSLVDHVRSDSEGIRSTLRDHGAIAFQGFSFNVASDAASALAMLGESLVAYTERSSPRTEVGDRVYTATDYPAAHRIFFHNENSYQLSWPRWLLFACESPATAGGDTLLSDVAEVARVLDPEILAEFARRDWLLVRNYGGPLGMDWRTSFQTSEKAAVEAYCRSHGISFEWTGSDRLRTKARRPALATYPSSGQPLWFNHAAFFHFTTLESETREALREFVPEDELPANTYYGDGQQIPDDVMEAVRSAYYECSTAYPWKAGDVVIVDNMRLAHARPSYEGPRRILVALAGSMSRSSAES